MIEIRVDQDSAVLQLRAMQRDIAEKAIVRALNKTAVTVRAEAASTIAKELRAGREFSVNNIRNKMMAIRRADVIRLTALVIAKKPYTLPAALFVTRAPKRKQRRGQTSYRTFSARYAQRTDGVQIGYRGKKIMLPGAWIAAAPGGREVVRVRSYSFKAQIMTDLQRRFGKGSRMMPASEPDYPIAEVRVPGVPRIFMERVLVEKWKRIAQERFAVVIAQEINYLKSKANG